MNWRCPPRVPDFCVCACSKQVSKSHTGTPQSTTRREPSRKATDRESATYQSRRKGKQTDERDVYATMVGSSARPEFGRLGHRARTRLARERHTWSDSLGLTNERFPTASPKHKTNYVWAEDDRAVRTTCREIAPSLYLNSSSLWHHMRHHMRRRHRPRTPHLARNLLGPTC